MVIQLGWTLLITATKLSFFEEIPLMLVCKILNSDPTLPFSDFLGLPPLQRRSFLNFLLLFFTFCRILLLGSKSWFGGDTGLLPQGCMVLCSIQSAVLMVGWFPSCWAPAGGLAGDSAGSNFLPSCWNFLFDYV